MARMVSGAPRPRHRRGKHTLAGVILAAGDPAASREVSDLLAINQGLGGKFEAGDVAGEGETPQPHRHLDAPLIFARDFALK